MITLIKTNSMEESMFECPQLHELDKITRIKDSFKHYLYAFPKNKAEEKRKNNFVFVIRIPGASVGLIEVSKELKIISAEYYQGEYNLKIFDKKDLEECNEALKDWVGKSLIILKETKDIESFFKED